MQVAFPSTEGGGAQTNSCKTLISKSAYRKVATDWTFSSKMFETCSVYSPFLRTRWNVRCRTLAACSKYMQFAFKKLKDLRFHIHVCENVSPLIFWTQIAYIKNMRPGFGSAHFNASLGKGNIRCRFQTFLMKMSSPWRLSCMRF